MFERQRALHTLVISHITLFVLFIGNESVSCDIKHSKQWPNIAVVEYARVVSLHCSRIFQFFQKLFHVRFWILYEAKCKNKIN